MILDSIILENFGAYSGRQEAVLTPASDKPIILFGGMNGGGKTTLLDALQLAFYGPKARLSNRGRMAYKDYLRECIHRDADPGEGAAITVRFRRHMEGESHSFELQRYWREGIKGVEETLRVFCDGKPDSLFTDHWDEVIDGYLPSSIAHLFFFDGEQIKELAEGDHTANILGTAVHSLLGLDLVDRLEADLKVLERRKKTEGMDKKTLEQLAQAKGELEAIDKEQENAAMTEGTLVTEAGRLAKNLRGKEEQFRTEGGELYLQRKEIEAALHTQKVEKQAGEKQLRELIAGPLPLLLLETQLKQVEVQSRHETEIHRARMLSEALLVRDRQLLVALNTKKIAKPELKKIEEHLEQDRSGYNHLAKEPTIIDAGEALPAHLAHLWASVLPQSGQKAKELTNTLTAINEQVARLECEIERIPSEDSIALAQQAVVSAKKAHDEKLKELENIRVRRATLQRQREQAEIRMDKLGNHEIDGRIADDDRLRILKHSNKVRNTLLKFRTKVVTRHANRIESLMLESFQKLLRKPSLVQDLKIDPMTYRAVLTGSDGKNLPFDRLSAGERQLLATSMLWGLARASGRPVPTVIDTPLSRLDSSHRKHLIERYFPSASHQVLLLSTDEEIVGQYYEDIKPYVSQSYLLKHNEKQGSTQIIPGYFDK